MAKKQFIIIGYVVLLIFLAVAGCVAPPTETQTGPVDLYNPNQFTPGTTTNAGPSGLLAEATPFGTTVTPTNAASVFNTPTSIPEDMVCLIDFSDYNWTFAMNKTAKKIELKNPPMYINYSIKKPYNVTGTRIITQMGADTTVSYSYYSPYSYLDINVRDPITGESYTRGGFGKDQGNSLNKTLQVNKQGNLLIEISGYNVTPTIGFWVKPANLDTATVNTSVLECHTQSEVKKLFQ